jgi:hypothetical protein
MIAGAELRPPKAIPTAETTEAAMNADRDLRWKDPTPHGYDPDTWTLLGGVWKTVKVMSRQS